MRGGTSKRKYIYIMNTNLKNAVLKQIGVTEKEFKKYASDYLDASTGVTGFIYYSDTHEFAMDNQNLIIDLLDEMADIYGLEVTELVKSFGVFKGGIDKDELKDLYKFLGGNKNIEQGSITNVLAWLCVEELANEFNN